MKKKNLTIFAFIMGALASLAVPGTAMAGVWSAHPGSLCEAAVGSQSDFIQNTADHVASSLGGPIVIVCPIVRKTQNTQGARLFVELNRSNLATTNIICQINSVDTDGTILFSVIRTFSGVGDGFLDMTVPTGMSTAWSHYNLACQLPATQRGWIYNYTINEKP